MVALRPAPVSFTKTSEGRRASERYQNALPEAANLKVRRLSRANPQPLQLPRNRTPLTAAKEDLFHKEQKSGTEFR